MKINREPSPKNKVKVKPAPRGLAISRNYSMMSLLYCFS